MDPGELKPILAVLALPPGGPLLLALLGLLLLAEKEEMSENLNDLFEMMQVCTRQLEKIISDFTQKVGEGL